MAVTPRASSWGNRVAIRGRWGLHMRTSHARTCRAQPSMPDLQTDGQRRKRRAAVFSRDQSVHLPMCSA
eukprot:1833939-Prymnesium_polylepis.1